MWKIPQVLRSVKVEGRGGMIIFETLLFLFSLQIDIVFTTKADGDNRYLGDKILFLLSSTMVSKFIKFCIFVLVTTK